MSNKKEDDLWSLVLEFTNKTVKSSRPLFVGIDPGASGAIAVRCGDYYAVFDIPVIKVARSKATKTKKAKSKTSFDYQTIATVFKALKKSKPGRPLYAVVEEAQVGIPGKGNSAYNGFRVGCSYGMWPLFLVSLGFSLIEVRPSIWKKKLGLTGKDKETSRHKAMMMFPKAGLSRKKDHDRAEALLLTEYLKKERSG